MATLDVVRDLALEGASHFHASHVAKQLGIPTEDAHGQLAKLETEGVVEVHFDVICPETLATIKTYKLREEIPFGEWMVEPTGDCEPFRLEDSDLLVTYSPTRDYTQRLLRNGERSGSKKKTPGWKRLLRTVFRQLRFSSGTNRDQFTSMRRRSRESKPTSHRRQVAAQR